MEFPELHGPIAVDTETCDPDLLTKGPGWCFDDGGFLVGISISCDNVEKMYLPIAHEGGGNLDKQKVVNYLSDQLSRKDQRKIFGNSMYDIGWLSTEGIQVAGPIDDVLIQAPLLDEHRFSYDIDSIAKDYLGVGKSTEELDDFARTHFGLRNKNQIRASMWRFPADKVREYAEQDAYVTRELYRIFSPKILEEELEKVYQLELDLIPVLMDMRRRGVRVDVEKAERVLQQLLIKEKELLAEIHRLTGVMISASDSKSAGPALEAVGIECPLTPKTRKPSVTKEFLESLSGQVPDLINRARTVNKIHGTFITNSILKHHHNGRIHCELLSVKGESGGTVGGRFCLRKGSRVHVPGSQKCIEEIKEGDLVYSLDDKLNLCLRKVIWSGCTGRKKIVRLHWQSTGNHFTGYLDLTENHEVRLWEGTYVCARDLKEGDSILALHRNFAKPPWGYNILSASKNPNVGREGVFVFREINKWVPEEVHHINHVKHDDRPENLMGMSTFEHRSHHAKLTNPEKKSLAQKKRWEDNYEQMKASCLRGKEHGMYRDISAEQLVEALRLEKGRPTYAAKRLGIWFGTFTEKCIENNIDYMEYRKWFNANGEQITGEDLLEAREIEIEKGIGNACAHLRIGWKKYEELQELAGLEILPRRRVGAPGKNNHRIVKIEYLEVEDEVYDIEVEETHCFFANELCVHNSSRNPNLQQIPAKDPELAPMIRDMFLPEEGELWCAADYSSQEPRLTVHFGVAVGAPGAQKIAQQYQDEPRTDYHQLVADICGIARKPAKTINLGLTYGMGEASLCRGLGLPTAWTESRNGKTYEVAGPEGKAVLEQYHKALPFLRKLDSIAKGKANSRQFVRTLSGRKCRFKKVEGRVWDTHKALNRIVQGSAADQTKTAMVELYRQGIPMLLSIHDEIDFSVPREGTREYVHRIEEIMTTCVPNLHVPFVVDSEVGPTWGTARLIDEDDE